MVATQVLRRRGTSTQCEAMTPAEAEIIVDLTNDSLRVGDGLRMGGFIMPNFNQLQNQTFQFAVAGGTADAITLTLNPAPLSLGQPLKVKFKAIATNTGSATLNVNGLGAVTIQKIVSGALTNLAAGDIINGGIYEVTYDGSVFQLPGLPSGGIVSVGQADLRTSSGSGSIGQVGTSINTVVLGVPNNSGYRTNIGTVTYDGATNIQYTVVMPGGQYGFYPQTYQSGTLSARTFYYQQRYITSSPPYDLGDGEVGGFIFVHLNSSGEIVQTYIADTPPWAYNGPTDIRATHKCPITGKKYRKVLKKRTFEQIMDGAAIEYKDEEITHKIKNADMGLIPHPFGDIPNDHKVLMLDPMSDKVARLIEMQNNGYSKEVTDMISSDYLVLDNSIISRSCPKKVTPCKFSFKGKK